MMLATFPCIWVAWAFVFRGGITFWITGIALVQADGRKAARWRCAWRAFLVWLPVAGLLIASAWLEAYYWWVEPRPYWVLWPSWLMWWAALLLLPAYLVAAAWNPTRGPHDRLAGTYLVPR
jgi:hypothetical protein